MVFPTPFAHIPGSIDFNPQSTALPQNRAIKKEETTKETELKDNPINENAVNDLNSMMTSKIFQIPKNENSQLNKTNLSVAHPQFNMIPTGIMPEPRFNTIPTNIQPQFAYNSAYINPYEQYIKSLTPQQPHIVEALQEPQRLNTNKILFV